MLPPSAVRAVRCADPIGIASRPTRRSCHDADADPEASSSIGELSPQGESSRSTAQRFWGPGSATCTGWLPARRVETPPPATSPTAIRRLRSATAPARRGAAQVRPAAAVAVGRGAGLRHMRQRRRGDAGHYFSRHENAPWRLCPGPAVGSGDPGQGLLLGERRRVGRFARWASSPGFSFGRPCDLPGLCREHVSVCVVVPLVLPLHVNQLGEVDGALTRWVGRAIGLDVHRDFCVVAICEDGQRAHRRSGAEHAGGIGSAGAEPSVVGSAAPATCLDCAASTYRSVSLSRWFSRSSSRVGGGEDGIVEVGRSRDRSGRSP